MTGTGGGNVESISLSNRCVEGAIGQSGKEREIMTNLEQKAPAFRRLRSRRAGLLATVAALGIAVGVGGTTLYRPSDAHLFAGAQAAEAQMQQPSGFADLVARVKPAVISVRVELNQSARTASMDQDSDNQDANPSRPGQPG